MDSAVARRIAREMALVLSRKVGPHVFHGATMLPFLVDGDEVEIEPVTFDDVRAGDVITYRDQQYFPTRRVIRIDGRSRSLILKGDAIPHLTFFVLEEDILGRATSIRRGDRSFGAGDAEWRRVAETILAREQRRARTAWLPDWLGLGPADPLPDRRQPPVARAAPLGHHVAGEPWWRVGRAAVDLDALQVVLALLADEPDRAAWMFARMKPRRFLDFARENGIAGDLIVLARDAGGGVSAVFDPIIAELIESARSQRAVNGRFVRHLGELSEVFDRVGIPWILLKGPHLSLGYYGSLDQRRMGDLDLLVRRDDLRAASRALVDAGYASKTGAPLGMGPALRFVHHLEHEKDGVPVDLHHQIRVHPTLRFDEANLWRTAGRLDLGDCSVRVLSDEYVLVTLILSIHTDIGLGTADLHAFFDLDRVLARVGETFDWETFFEARHREQTSAIAVNVLALLGVLMGARGRHAAMLAAIDRRLEHLVLRPDRRDYVQLIHGSTLAAKKRWAFAQLAMSLPAATLWWLLGLPIHALVYRRTFFRNFGERLALRRPAPAPRVRRGVDGVPKMSAPVSPLRAIGVGPEALPPMTARPMRLGSLAIELQSDRSFAPDTLEELFRLEGARAEAGTVAPPDVRVRVFDASLDDLHRLVPPPISAVVRRDLEGIVEIHHKAASAIVARPRAAGPVEVVLPVRPASTICARAGTRIDEAGSGEASAGATAPAAGVATAAHGAAEPDQAMLVHSLMIVFYRTLLELGCLHLHAAAVEMGGETSLFLGGKGAGKSTLCLALGQAGATILGEDHVLVRRRDGGRFAVSGCDANMRLTEKTESELFNAPPMGRTALFGGVLKREFDLRETGLVVRPFVDFLPRRIFFPIVGTHVAIDRISRADAMVRILGSVHDRHAIATAADGRGLLDFVGDLVDSLETYALQLSPDLGGLATVADFLARPRR